MSMAQVCALFEISRQAHYQQMQRDAQGEQERAILLELVRQIRRKHPRMGGRKLLFKIQPMAAAQGLTMGRDRLFGLLAEADLLVKRHKSQRRTTIPGLWVAKNLLPGLSISVPNQVWVCDITYIELQSGFAYLFVLMDLFSRYIVGWHVSASLAADGALACLQMARRQLPRVPAGLIHHSDHGVQYTSHAYLETLFEHHILPSMGAVGSCYDNIFAERLMGTLKNEYLLDARFSNLSQVTHAVQEVVYQYNTDRPHLSLNLAVPQAVYTGMSSALPPLLIPLAT